MTDAHENEPAPTKEERYQALLYKVQPICALIGLTVAQLGETVTCTVPFQHPNKSHSGVMYAWVQFALAEALGGISVSQYREFAGDLLLARNVSIKFFKPARSSVTGVVEVKEKLLADVREGLLEAGKIAFQLDVDLMDEDGELVSRTLCDFQLSRRKIAEVP